VIEGQSERIQGAIGRQPDGGHLHALLVNSKAMAPRLAVKHRAAVGDPSACAQAELSELYEQSLALGGPAKGEHTLVR